jgi:hypothetical protein
MELRGHGQEGWLWHDEVRWELMLSLILIAMGCFTAHRGEFDNEGWPDVHVACDSTPSLLFHDNRDGALSENRVPAGFAYNEDGHEQAGMGRPARNSFSLFELPLTWCVIPKPVSTDAREC